MAASQVPSGHSLMVSTHIAAECRNRDEVKQARPKTESNYQRNHSGARLVNRVEPRRRRTSHTSSIYGCSVD